MRLMDVTPTISTKRPRTKVVAQEPTTKQPRKTAVASRTKSTEVRTAPEESATSSTDLHELIETAAFYLAAERSFAPGHELDDWLEAERRIKAQHSA
jgi:hypothetical protein